MDHHGTKPVWHLTLWALAGFLLAALAMHIANQTPRSQSEIAVPGSETAS